METTLTVGGQTYTVQMTETTTGWEATVAGVVFRIKVDRRGTQAAVDAGGHVHIIELQDERTASIDGVPVHFHIDDLKGVAGAQEARTGGHGPIKPPMTGRLEHIAVAEGDTVARGDVLFVLEAMKMRNEVKSQSDGIVGKIHVQVGDAVEPSTIVLELLPP